MKENPVKQKLRNGEPVFGTMVLEFASPGLPTILEQAGAEFIIYDMEAGCLDIAIIKNQMALTRGLKIVPIVNTAWRDYAHLVGPLDQGALGLMVPVIDSATDAALAVSMIRYAPEGIRGAAFGIAHDDYDGGPFAPKIQAVKERTLLITKIETVDAIRGVDSIVAVDGVDVAFLGHMDLSVSLGVPGDFDHPDFREARGKLVAACAQHKKSAGCMVANSEHAKKMIDLGFTFIVAGTDASLLANGFSSSIPRL